MCFCTDEACSRLVLDLFWGVPLAERQPPNPALAPNLRFGGPSGWGGRAPEVAGQEFYSLLDAIALKANAWNV